MAEKSIWKKMLGTVVEFEDEQPKPTTQYTPPQYITNDIPMATPPEQLSKFNSIIDNLLKEMNLAGPDYIEFIHMADSMKARKPSLDNATLFLGALTALEASSGNELTKNKLIETANIYISKLEEYKNTLESEAQNDIQQSNQENENKISELNEENLRLQETIRTMQNKIVENENQTLTLRSLSGEKANKINNKILTFKSVYTDRVNKIKTDLEIIKNL